MHLAQSPNCSSLRCNAIRSGRWHSTALTPIPTVRSTETWLSFRSSLETACGSALIASGLDACVSTSRSAGEGCIACWQKRRVALSSRKTCKSDVAGIASGSFLWFERLAFAAGCKPRIRSCTAPAERANRGEPFAQDKDCAGALAHESGTEVAINSDGSRLGCYHRYTQIGFRAGVMQVILSRPKKAQPAWQEMVEELDLDHNGVISFNEFQHYFMNAACICSDLFPLGGWLYRELIPRRCTMPHPGLLLDFS